MAISAITPASKSLEAKTALVERTDTSAKNLFVIPKGAVQAFYTVASTTASDAGTSATLDIGISGNADLYIDALDVTAATTTATMRGINLGGVKEPSEVLVQGIYTESGTASTEGGPWRVTAYYYQTGPGEL